MDDTARVRAMELLGRFNDDMTAVFDQVLGTQWAEIEEMAAFAALVAESPVTTRRLTDVSGLHRRAVSRLISRLRSSGLVSTRPASLDRRAVEVVLTVGGEQQAAAFRASVADFFRASSEIAQEISRGLDPARPPQAPAASTDQMELLGRVCAAGAALVRVMPDAALQGRFAARQRAALVLIATQGQVRPSHLSAILKVSRAGSAYIVDQLCAKGFVVRVHGALPEDARAVVLEITADGLQAVRAVSDGIAERSGALAALFAEVAAWGRSAT